MHTVLASANDDTLLPLWFDFGWALAPAAVVLLGIIVFYITQHISLLLNMPYPNIWALSCAIFPPCVLLWLFVLRKHLLMSDSSFKTRRNRAF